MRQKGVEGEREIERERERKKQREREREGEAEKECGGRVDKSEREGEAHTRYLHNNGSLGIHTPSISRFTSFWFT